MDIAALHAFVAVAETGSFTEAALRLFITQPAVSKRVAALEEELGRPLFDRIGRRVSLTEAGGALLPRARAIIEQVEESRRAIADLSGGVSGTLRFGTSHHIGLHRLPPVLHTFLRRYPEVELDIRFLDSEAACQAVEQGELELAVVTLPLAPSPRLHCETVWPDPLAVVCAQDHPLARRRRVTLADLGRHPAILPGSGTFTRQIVAAAFAREGIALTTRLATNYLETIHMLVAVGMGWGVLPETLATAELRCLRVPELTLARNLGLVIHIARTPSNAALAMTELLRAHITDPD